MGETTSQDLHSNLQENMRVLILTIICLLGMFMGYFLVSVWAYENSPVSNSCVWQ